MDYPITGNVSLGSVTGNIKLYVNEGGVNNLTGIGYNNNSMTFGVNQSIFAIPEMVINQIGDISIIGNVSTGGNLVVNSTTASTSSTTGALRVAGGAGIVGNINVGGFSNFAFDSSFSGNILLTQLNNPLQLVSRNASTINSTLSTNTDDVGIFYGTTNPAAAGLIISPRGTGGGIKMDIAGNVGIGMNPTEKLHVNGMVRSSDLRIDNGNIHLGQNAGLTSQGANCVAIGFSAGQTSQGQRSIAIGDYAGSSGLGGNSIAIGARARASVKELSNFISRSSANEATAWYAITNGIPSTGIYQGQTLFVAPGYLTSTIMTSVDGINWVSRNIGILKGWIDIVYGIPSQGIYAGQGLFVCVSMTATNNYFSISPDGINWTATASARTSTGALRCITYGAGVFVAGSQSAYMMYSTDGINWTQLTAAPVNSGQWSGITYGGGKFVAVAYTSNSLITSSDGISWSAIAIPSFSQAWHGITYGIPYEGIYAGQGLFVATGQAAASTSHVMTSPDGITWIVRTTPSIGGLLRISYGNGYFVAVSFNSNLIIISIDGINWMLKTNYLYGYGITYGIPSSGQDMFITVGDTAANRVTTATLIYSNNSTAIGASAIVNGSNSIAIGFGASTGIYGNSVAIGAGAVANGNNQIMIGTASEAFHVSGNSIRTPKVLASGTTVFSIAGGSSVVNIVDFTAPTGAYSGAVIVGIVMNGDNDSQSGMSCIAVMGSPGTRLKAQIFSGLAGGARFNYIVYAV